MHVLKAKMSIATRTRVGFLVMLALAAALPAKATESSSHFAKLDDGQKIPYTVAGRDEPTLVFIHGWACDQTVWNAQVADLSNDMRCVTIDLPGHGQSDKPPIDYTMHLYARAIDAVLRDAGVKLAVLVGHSNGTPGIRQFYREYPASVRALVIVDGALRAMADAATIHKFLEPFHGSDYPKMAGKFVDDLTGTIKDNALRERIKTTILKTLQSVSVSELESTTDPAIWKADKIEVPVLMILARQPAWTPEYEKFVRDLVPKLDYQTWDGVSHFIMMEKPKEFNDAVRGFLRTNHFLDATGN